MHCPEYVNAKSRVGGTVTILKEPIRGSYFGKCMCGLDTRDAVPCEHMAAVVVSSCIPMLTQENIMPYWRRTDHWRKQFPNSFRQNATFPWRPHVRMANQTIRSCIVHLDLDLDLDFIITLPLGLSAFW